MIIKYFLCLLVVIAGLAFGLLFLPSFYITYCWGLLIGGIISIILGWDD